MNTKVFFVVFIAVLGIGITTPFIVGAQSPLLPTITIGASPSTVDRGSPTIISWNTVNAASCYGLGAWSGPKATSGAETTHPLVDSTYILVCNSGFPGQYSSAHTIVRVNSFFQQPQQSPIQQNNVNSSLAVTNLVLNKTLNQSTFTNSVEARETDTLVFEIRVRNTGASLTDITVRDILPKEIFYLGSTTVNGAAVSDGIAGAGLNLSSVVSGQEIVIRFSAIVSIGIGQTTVVNQAAAINSSGFSNSGFATIILKGEGQVLGVGDIVTGPENVVPWALAIGFFATLFIHLVFFRRREETVNIASELETEIRKLRTEENPRSLRF